MNRTLLTALLIVCFVNRVLAQDERIVRQLESSKAALKTAKDVQDRRAVLREGFLKGARLWPLPKKTPLQPIIHSKREHDGYAVENVALETFPGFYCTGNLYKPLTDGQKCPAILCPHGHFGPLGRYREHQQIRCAQFARMGAVVFSYSMVGWQDSQQTKHDDPVVVALQTWNSIRVVDFLTGLSEVDPKRIGVTGASGGGTQTFFLAAVDDRITVSAPAVIVYPWSWFSAGCHCETGMPVMKSPETNAIELAALAAPRPQLIISCGWIDDAKKQKDPTHDFPKTGFPFIQHVYKVAGHPDRLKNLHLADEAHDFGPSKRRAVYAFFAGHLGMELLEEDVTKIIIEPPEKLAVFTQDHPLPKQAARGSAEVGKAFAQFTRSK